MRRVIVFVVALALVIIACSTSIKEIPVEEPEENQTVIVQEDDDSSFNDSLNATEEESVDVVDITEEESVDVVDSIEEESTDVVIEDDAVVTVIPKDNPCVVLINMTEQLEGMAQERIDCLDWLEKGFNSAYLPVIVMVKYELYYQGSIDHDPLLSEISGNLASVAYALKIYGSAENSTQIFEAAIFNVVKNTYILSDKLGVEEMYIRVYFSENTYMDIFVSMETLHNLPSIAIRYDVLNSLTFALFIDGEEQSAEESEPVAE